MGTTIYKRTGKNARASNKNWVAQVRTPDGRRRSASFREKSEARAWSVRIEHAALAEAQAGSNEWPIDSPGVTGVTQTVGSALALYEHTAPQYLAASTWRDCQAPVCRYWLGHEFAERELTSLFPQDIRVWIGTMRREGLAAGTIRKRLNVLRQAIDMLIERVRLRIPNPAAGHRIQRDPARRRRPTSD